MSLDAFQEKCRCSLRNAIDIVTEHSLKKHAFLVVDEVNRVPSTSSAFEPISLFKKLMATITPLIDLPGTATPLIGNANPATSTPVIDVPGYGKPATSTSTPVVHLPKHRVNVVFSSLASVPLMDFETSSGRKRQVNPSFATYLPTYLSKCRNIL
jgi:hypothetical protein